MADQQQNTGQFIPTTQIWDIGQLYEVDVNSEDFKELLVRLYQNVNRIALALNTKETGYYLQEEFVSSNAYFHPTSNSQDDLRPSFKKAVNIGALALGVNTKAHGLTIESSWTFTHIWGTASNPATYTFYPLPWASAVGATNIELKVDVNNIVITNNSGLTFSSCMVVLEYLKQ
jgi:hypothetical protein